MIALFGIIAASVALEVQTSQIQGLGSSEVGDAITLLLEILGNRELEACWDPAIAAASSAVLPAVKRCAEPNAPEILSVELFGGISRVRWIFSRRSRSGTSLGQLQLDLLRKTPERDRLEEGLLTLLPPITKQVDPSPVLADARAENSPWPAVIGFGGGCVATVGAALLISGLAAKHSMATPSRDLDELAALDDRRVTHGAVGATLVGVGLGAVVLYLLTE